MRAYRCDRCGKFFAHSCRDADKIFVTDSYTSVACNRIKDLCADCQREFEAWWRTGKRTEEAEDEQHTD